MRTAIVGGGMLGLTLAFRLAGLGHDVDVFEAGPRIGGLAQPHDYGPFTWDRFYHCILPQDRRLIALLEELGFADEGRASSMGRASSAPTEACAGSAADVRWTRTGTGFWAHGRAHDMNGALDLLRFPLLAPLGKLRLAATMLRAARLSDPRPLYGVTAERWLTRACGRRTYEVFWRPLLRAKFGPYHDRVAAVFLWATIARLAGARGGGARREHLGYVRGGYRRILARFTSALAGRGARVHCGAAVSCIEPHGGGCRMRLAGIESARHFDQVFFTGPTRLAARVAAGPLAAIVEDAERDHPTAGHYLGVVCLVLVLRRPLTRYYVLNVGDASIPVTGVIEMTNLIARETETAGRALVYVPRYLDSEDPLFAAPDGAIVDELLGRGVRRLFPALADADVESVHVHRARLVQPLPLAQPLSPERGRSVAAPDAAPAAPALARPFQVLNTSMLRCATLNNDEVVGLVDAFVDANRAALDTFPTRLAGSHNPS